MNLDGPPDSVPAVEASSSLLRAQTVAVVALRSDPVARLQPPPPRVLQAVWSASAEP